MTMPENNNATIRRGGCDVCYLNTSWKYDIQDKDKIVQPYHHHKQDEYKIINHLEPTQLNWGVDVT